MVRWQSTCTIVATTRTSPTGLPFHRLKKQKVKGWENCMNLRRYTRTPLLWLAVVVMLVGPSILIANAANRDSNSSETTQTDAANLPSISRDKASYEPGDTIVLSGSNWAAGESVTITIS